MDTKLKEEWVKALRSGKYQQGGNVLRRGNSFCCLGVLCDLRDPKGWAETEQDGARWFAGVARGFLPTDFRNDAGLTSDQEGDLAGMNDDGKPFPEIADYIEANL